ncbi:hypothetical protein RM844_05890 [Streptomyces sp. DSM 44915]|uniref:Uncharacterized protein n=1 Tax=Streptomyces chisholmiae TaxID=3075540 RepID=A0ABU2JMR5_9ACTN|nr:hypothetical protein [Streptomyces sp. DSM 44915]MDT0265819.1 hypothetical protein [Streptomyces sp. DSM 44915]
MDVSGWPLERLRVFAVEGDDWWRLEAVRLVAQQRALAAGQPAEVRRRWAALALFANRRTAGDGATRALTQEFWLRTWVIERLGPEPGQPDWEAEALADDTLAALTLTAADAAARADDWRALPLDEIRALRRHKNLTAHLATLVDQLEPGPRRDQLLPWVRVRGLLP